MKQPYIEIKKLRRNTKILLETEKTVFEVIVSGPKSCSVTVTGGSKFIRPTKAKIKGPIKKKAFVSKKGLESPDEGIIKRGSCIEFQYENKGFWNNLITSKILSATIYAPDNSWSYDAIEKNENTN